MTTYFVAFSTPTISGTFTGRAFVTADRLTRTAIERWEQTIQNEMPGATSVTISNIVKLEDPS